MGEDPVRLKTQTLQELMAKEFAPETGEHGYRRGYRDGYIEAVNAANNLPRRVSVGQMLHFMFEHWRRALWDWEHDESGRKIRPPHVVVPDNAVRRSFLPRERDHIRREFDDRCAYCNRAGRVDGADPDGYTWEIDHVVPLVEGGTNDPENLALSCKACNARKGGK